MPQTGSVKVSVAFAELASATGLCGRDSAVSRSSRSLSRERRSRRPMRSSILMPQTGSVVAGGCSRQWTLASSQVTSSSTDRREDVQDQGRPEGKAPREQGDVMPTRRDVRYAKETVDGEPRETHRAPEQREQPPRGGDAVEAAVDEEERKAMRSAKMKEITPPKATPCPHSVAASGMLPTEHTHASTATSGASATFSSTVHVPCPLTKRWCHHDPGTCALKKPATRNPAASSTRIIVRSPIV